MTTSTIASFIDNLRDSRLLQAGQIDELLRTPDAQEVDASTLGQCLVQLGWLTPFQLDEVIQGRGPGLTLAPYRLVDKLGEGPLGASYKAQHTEREGLFVVRLIPPERLMSGPAQERFLKATMAASALTHPGLARVLGVEAAGEHVVYVREYVEGTDLARLVQDQGAVPVTQACDLLQQAANALQAIHDQGLTHGRLDPSNLIAASGANVLPAGASPAVKLVDLGLSALEEPAPAPVDRDMAALGKLFAHLLSGGAETLPDSVPEPVREVHRRLLARVSEGGFGSAAEVAQALAPHGTPPPPALVEPPTPVLAEPEAPPPVAAAPEPMPAAAPALDISPPPPPPVPPAPTMPPEPPPAAYPAAAAPTAFTSEPALTPGAFAEAPSRLEAPEQPLLERRKRKYGARFWILALLGLLLHIFAFGILVIAVMRMMEAPSTYRSPATGPRVFPTRPKQKAEAPAPARAGRQVAARHSGHVPASGLPAIP